MNYLNDRGIDGDDARGLFSFAILGGCAFAVIAVGLAIAYLIFKFAASL